MTQTGKLSARKIPATVITGFLGAGKTTLIRNLLENSSGRRYALIINEFGDVGVDGKILKECGVESCGEDDIVELANGCICCTVADDFLPTMAKLLDRDVPPDHIIIETSGLALPKPLVKAFNWPEVRTRVTVDGVVTLIDVDAVSQGRFAMDEDAVAQQRADDASVDHDNPLEELFEDQLQCADLVLLTKTDLVTGARLDEIEVDLKGRVRDGVRFVRIAHGAVDTGVLLGVNAGAEDSIDARWSHHDTEADHDHDDFESFVFKGPELRNVDALIAGIKQTMKLHDILRLKGFAAVAGKPMRLVIQAVGPRIEHYFDRAWTAGETRYTQLVVIGEKGLAQTAIADELTAAIG
ncbi:MAG: cobalamin biosynthesis protein CobW [Rhizomicrobium sp.]